jgi:hypothetical protein
MILHLAFYKSPGTWLNALVRRATNSPYSHAELVFDMGRDGRPPLCYSSDSRALGIVRLRRMALPPEAWDLVPVEVTPAERDVVWAFTLHDVGSPYDLLGALRFVVPWMPPSPTGWFCSDLIVSAFQRAGWWTGVEGWRTSPGALYGMVTQRGGPR